MAFSSNKISPEPTVLRLQEKTSTPASQEQGCLGILTWPQALALILGLCLLIAILIVLPIVLVNTVRTPTNTPSTITTTTSVTTTTTSVTSTTTTSTTSTQTVTTTTTTTTSFCGVGCTDLSMSLTSLLAGYNFDSNTNDITSVYPASGLSSPTYVTGYAAGSAIYIDATSTQQLTTSPMNLFNKSFTVELWFYLTRASTQNNAFFGQQSLSNVGDYCLFLMTYFGKLYMGFYGDDTSGSTILQNNTWYHAAFVYDNDKRQRSIYLNGVLDGQSATGVGPYLGTTGSMTIASANVDGNIGRTAFSGYLDQLMIYTRAKTACEILNDATLVAYFPFDGNYIDAGPNSLSMTSSGASITTGYINQGVYLSGSNSYLQVGGLINLGRSNYPYSIAFWVYPIVKGVLVHISSNSTGVDWCTPFINFNSSGNLVTQVYDATNTILLLGPSLITNGWTHVTQTYSPTDGQRLYINGALYAYASASTTYRASGKSNYLTFGSLLSGQLCDHFGAVQNVFQGSVDELRIYSRALSSVDACLLAQL